ncbi:hypothetical protein YC2023_122412 [Brassica napus]
MCNAFFMEGYAKFRKHHLIYINIKNSILIVANRRQPLPTAKAAFAGVSGKTSRPLNTTRNRPNIFSSSNKNRSEYTCSVQIQVYGKVSIGYISDPQCRFRFGFYRDLNRYPDYNLTQQAAIYEDVIKVVISTPDGKKEKWYHESGKHVSHSHWRRGVDVTRWKAERESFLSFSRKKLGFPPPAISRATLIPLHFSLLFSIDSTADCLLQEQRR